MQEEARCEQQSTGAWQVSLHPSGREVAAYYDEEEALDVTDLINLKIKLDAKLPTEGLTDGLNAKQIERVTNMSMEELLQKKVVPEQAKSESDDINSSNDDTKIHTTNDDEEETGDRKGYITDTSNEDSGGSEVSKHGSDYCATTEELDGQGEECDEQECSEHVSVDKRRSGANFWQRNPDGSYSKVLPTASGRSCSMPQTIRTEIFGSSTGNDVVCITKSSAPELDNRQFDCQLYVSPTCKGYVKHITGLTKLLRFLKAKKGDTITLSKGDADNKAFVSLKQLYSATTQANTPKERKKVSNPQAPVLHVGRWIKNRDGSYSKPLPPKFGSTRGNKYLTINPEIIRQLVRHQNRDFIMIAKSADPEVDGKHFSVGIICKKDRGKLTSFPDVARCLNLQPNDIITLSKGPDVGEVYISVTEFKQSVMTIDKVTTSPSGDHLPGVQKRQLPSSDLQAPPAAAKRHKTSTKPSFTPGVGQHRLQKSAVAPAPVPVVQGAAERRSLPEMLALVKSIIEKEAVGLSAAERISYRTMFMIKMTSEVQVSSLQMLEELDGAGEHNGVKLCVQMSLKGLN